MSLEKTSWQASILASFQPKEPMLVVIDPDNLLADESLLAEIQNSSYDILQLEDEVTFRNRFEHRYRSRWDAGEPRHVVVIVHTTASQRHIPYDLLQKGKRIEVGISQLFPQLNAITVMQLDRAYLADLYIAHQALVERGEILHGERLTIEFILRAVFGIDPAAHPDPARLVEMLIHRHYLARLIPIALLDYVTKSILPKLAELAIHTDIVSDAPAFYAWLATQWQAFVNAAAGAPLAINFGDLRLRPLLANLFADGKLARIKPPASLAAEEWLAIGLLPTSGKHKIRDWGKQDLYNLQARLQLFINLDPTGLPQGKTDLRDWLNLAAEWSEAVYQVNSLPLELYEEVRSSFFAARASLDKYFIAFIQLRYSAVDYYQDNLGPLSLAGVNAWLAQNVKINERLALICFDGLALDQLLLLKEYVSAKIPGLTYQENRTYAMAPTITPNSRQALFSGRPPVAFAETWDKTNADAARWNTYWVHREIPEKRITHLAINPSSSDFNALQSVIDSKNVRLGILINLFDDVMHSIKEFSAQTDKRIYYDTLRSYLENGSLGRLFTMLLEGGYRIFISSDHGNLSGVGNGITPPKALIENYARRVAIFDSEPLAKEFAAKCSGLVFRTKSLPADIYPVYLPGQTLFAPTGSVQISHGGLSLEELIVPFVEVTRP